MTTSSPTVSVIVPVHNGARYLDACLTSVLNQTWTDFEVIVVDDGSTDDSPDVYGRYPVRVINQTNQGQSAARNRGVGVATGRFVAFLDQDDVWHPDKLAIQVPIAEAGNGVIYSNVDLIDANGEVIEPAFLDHMSIHPKASLADCLSRDILVLPGTILVRKDLFEQVGGFDPRLRAYEDDDLFLRLFQHSTVRYIPRALAGWRMHPARASHSEDMEKGRALYIEKLIDTFPDDPEAGTAYTGEVIAPRFARLYLIRYLQALSDGAAEADVRYLRTQLRNVERKVSPRRRLIWALAWAPAWMARSAYRLWGSRPRLPGPGLDALAEAMVFGTGPALARQLAFEKTTYLRWGSPTKDYRRRARSTSSTIESERPC